MPNPALERVVRKAIVFTCGECGEFLAIDREHGRVHQRPCPDCGGELGLIATGASNWVGDATWYRCKDCDAPFMNARGELSDDVERLGFEEFGRFDIQKRLS